MTTASKPTVPAKAQEPRHLQGDGRSFGFGKSSQRAVIKEREITPLLENLDLKPEARTALVRGITATMGDYLGAGIRAERKADHAETLELLASIAGKSRDLARALRRLDNDRLVLIDEERRALVQELVVKEQKAALTSKARFPVVIDDDRAETLARAHVGHFNFLHLIPALEKLGIAAGRVFQKTGPRPEGPPKKKRLDAAVEGLMPFLQKAGLPVTICNSGSAANRRQVAGTGGELLKAIFAAFDDRVKETNLYGALERNGLQPEGAKRSK